jgi:hypothetical protein
MIKFIMTKNRLLQDDKIIPTDKYPLLRGYEKSKGKVIKTSFFFSIEDVDETTEQEIEGFFKHTSLKEALKKYMGISSSKITSYINQTMFSETPESIELNLNYYLIIDILSTVFLRQPKPNPDDFLKALSQRKLIAMLSCLYNKKLQLQKFLNDNFSEEKKLELLQNSSRNDQVSDLLGMYMQDDSYFKEFLSKKNFKEISSLAKCHDLLAAQMSKITQKNFALKQETHYPVLKQLDNKILIDDYYLIVPQTHHDLITWGNILGHCIGAKHYAEAAYKGQSVLLGIANKNRLQYTLEINQKFITQIQGQSRSYPSKKVEAKLREELKNRGLI